MTTATSPASSLPRLLGSRPGRRLGRYVDGAGTPRELLALSGAAGSVLVVDCEAAGAGDPRLVAHLAADEPPENAAIVCRRYLLDVRARTLRPRRLHPQDTVSVPFAEELQPDIHEATWRDRAGAHRLEALDTGMSIPELRWRRSDGALDEHGRIVSLRDVIAHEQSYEPARTRTVRALLAHHADAELSTTVLRAELRRVSESPIVLNRKLREAVLAIVERDELSLSEIAARCGRIKRDRKGNVSGETSWLARRIGLLPEAGHAKSTPWIHSDVLAVIAREGLGVSPREVELG
jgi:hypothetical protein